MMPLAPISDLVSLSSPSALPGRPLTILLVAGEASGDARGAELIAALKELQPAARLLGVGGPRMAAAGQDQLFDLAAHAVLGLIGPLRHYAKFTRFFHQIVALARREKPDAVVLIDYAYFNLKLAARLRHELPGTRRIFYISPQVWAWKSGRAKTMARDLNLLLVIFPFEKSWFANAAPKLAVEWIGHPLVDRIARREEPQVQSQQIALLPGSRRTELNRHLPALWATARHLARARPELKFQILTPDPGIQQHALELIGTLPAANFEYQITIGYTLSHLSRSALALVASGTASLECALIRVPHLIIYRTDPLTYAIGRRLVKLKHLSILNIMAGRTVVPEYLQDALVPENIARDALALLDDPARRRELQEEVDQVTAQLGAPGASHRAAQAIVREAAFAKMPS